ncbi:MAG TPA: hypothetical protein VFS35_03030 [Terrimicrobiaceae bacterium]|nr:hypothetical protein [Terrimicrobiaceae bacterium]
MKKQVLISIDDSYMDRLPDVIEALEGEGLEVSRSLEALGVVSGAAEEGSFSSLRGVEGVNSLEEERTAKIVPPDAPLQ